MSRHERRIGQAGMPPLDAGGPLLSRFEFWPAWLFYAPIWIWIACLMVRHRGIRLPLIANPRFPVGGLVGEQKSKLFALFSGAERARLPDYIVVRRRALSADRQVTNIEARFLACGIGYPLVAKPDIGCRGAGVRPIRSRNALERYLQDFPVGEKIILQRMADLAGEAGVFYVREPGQRAGQIISLTLKYFPHVVGDGRLTLRELILADPRAGKVSHLYLQRFTHELDSVLAIGEARRLVFAGSHSQGAIFRNGNHYITEAMRRRFDAIADGIEEFHFGRFDVRFDDFESLRRGDGFSIIEYNGAGAESTHIWDARTGLFEAWRALFVQFSLLFRIGAMNRRRGFRPESWTEFFGQWMREKRLKGRYPATE